MTGFPLFVSILLMFDLWLILKGQMMITRVFILGIGFGHEHQTLKCLSSRLGSTLDSKRNYLTNFDRISFWDSDITQDPPTVEYEMVMKSDAGVKHWTELIVSALNNLDAHGADILSAEMGILFRQWMPRHG